MSKTIIAMIIAAFAIVGLFFIFRALGRFFWKLDGDEEFEEEDLSDTFEIAAIGFIACAFIVFGIAVVGVVLYVIGTQFIIPMIGL